jgi:regulator of protease activity HflC (stomatin/prohibitin superfamily)
LDTAGGQSFQSVSVDARVLYRTGLNDAAALKAAYAVSSPDDLVRAQAGRLLAQLFASQLLETVLGDNRETMAEALRARLQAELDRMGTGIELVAVVIEAIHPPAGAAEAYHNVQAAEIVANTTIAVERGRSFTTASFARQRTTDLVDGATGTAADTVADAKVAARSFTADQQAAQVGGEAFLLERYFANISAALAKSPLVIVDHRLTGTDAPVIDLRAFGAPPAPANGDD